MSEAMNVGMITSADVGDKVVLGLDVEDIAASIQRFGWPDYMMFVIMLALCVAIGVYFGYFHVAVDTQDYLMGGRNLSVFPVSMSLIASYISGISLLGIPTEVYVYGIQYFYILIGTFIMTIVMKTVYLPVFHELQVTSTYEYLSRRFDKKVRILASVLFFVAILLWLPVVIYVPALAFNQVTGINVHLITPIVCVTCIFYTTLGGLKAVVWTDVIQIMIMYGAMLLVAIKGTIDVGGLDHVWQTNWESGRIEAPNLEFDLHSRHTVWSLVIGGFVYWLQTASVNQNMIQRYLSLPTLKAANRSLWIFFVGIVLIVFLCCYNGLLIYTTYSKCDPLTTMLAREKDQLLPLLVMETLGDYPGLPGLFVAGIFSAALSSLSTGLNSMAAVVLEDFYKSIFSKQLTESQTSILMKLTVVFLGCLCVGLVFVVEKLGAVLQLTMSIGAISSGASLGLFTMGVLLPWINAKGALAGGITSLSFMVWLGFRAQAAIQSGDITFPEKPVSTEGCHYHFTPKLEVNIHYDPSVNVTNVTHTDERFMLYKLSYLWYTFIGAFISIIVGLLVSACTKLLDPRDIDPTLLSPFVRKLIKPRQFPNEPGDGIIYAYGPTNSIGEHVKSKASNGTEMFKLNGPESA